MDPAGQFGRLACRRGETKNRLPDPRGEIREVSYKTFKIYAREIGLAVQQHRAPTMVELPPGQETQIDYGSVGTLTDQSSDTDRRVQAFTAKLSCCRLPYIRFTYSQNSESFVESNARMLEFYGGVTECLLIDNLKSGVLKPHI